MRNRGKTRLLVMTAVVPFGLVSVIAQVDDASADQSSTPGTVDVQILGINDLHGHLEARGLFLDPATGKGGSSRPVAGGVAYLASHLRARRAQNPNTVIVSAGDLVGASPLISGYLHDEPTVEAMNALGLDIHAVGNHEFDEGYPELRRLVGGGCHPEDGCLDGTGYRGADFDVLGANVIDRSSGGSVFPATTIREFGGARVAFVGVTLQGTADLVAPAGVSGLSFRDEIDTVNAQVLRLRSGGADAIVVVLHEGAAQTSGGINECRGIAGPAVTITRQLDDAVDLVLSGHTHKAYNCVVDGKRLTSAASYGRAYTEIHLMVDPVGHRVVTASAKNRVVTRGRTPAGDLKDLIKEYRRVVDPIGTAAVGHASRAVTRAVDTSGESALSNLVADAQLAATRAKGAGGAQIAIVQRGVLRADINKGKITYEEVYRVQPSGHRLETMTLTGKQLDAVLEQQFCNPAATTNDRHVPLLTSRGFTYSWDPDKACGKKVAMRTTRLNGTAIRSAKTYRHRQRLPRRGRRTDHRVP